MVSFTKFRPYEWFVGRLEPRKMSGFGYGSSTTGSPLNPPDRTPSPLNTKSNFLSVGFREGFCSGRRVSG
jgi:hypothetical protein